MLSLAEVKKHVVAAFAEAGYNFYDYNIEVSINSRLTTTLGRCSYRKVNGIPKPYLIEISRQLLETSTDKSVIDVIYHEAAHALTAIETQEVHHHDKVFKAMCARIGTTNDGCKAKDLEHTVDESKIYKYFVICEHCGQVVGKYQRAGKVIKNLSFYHCLDCKGNLKVVQNF